MSRGLSFAHFSHVFSSCHGRVIKLQTIADKVTDIRLGTIESFGTDAGSLFFQKFKHKLSERDTARIGAIPNFLFYDRWQI